MSQGRFSVVNIVLVNMCLPLQEMHSLSKIAFSQHGFAPLNLENGYLGTKKSLEFSLPQTCGNLGLEIL